MAYIGLDVGTSGAKATVVSRDGRAITSVTMEYDLLFPAPGRIEISPDDVWEGCKKALAAVNARYGGEIEAISTSSFGEAVAMLDENDRTVCNSIFYSDARGNEELPLIREAVGDVAAFGRRTGMPINSMFTLPKLIWIKKNAPELLEKTRRMLPYGAYVNYRLSGEAATDSSQAARTLMFNIQKLDWDEPVLRAFSIPRDILPDYAPASAAVGRMLPSVAKELGFANCPLIVSGVHDQVSASLGSGAIDPGDMSDGIGTAECMTFVLPDSIDYVGMHEGNICTEPAAIPGRLLSLAFTSAAGASLKWYRDAFAAELKAECEKTGESAYAVLNRRMPETPSPLLFLPHLAGTGTPYSDPNAVGVMCGMTISTTKYDMYRAIIEGMNFEIKINLELMRKYGFAPNEIVCVGGGAKPDVLQIKSDILGVPLCTLEEPESGTVGMAMLCGVATGAFRDFREAIAATVRKKDLIEPSAKYRTVYEDKYEKYLRMYDACRAIYGR